MEKADIQIWLVLLTLEEKGLIDYDEDEDTFEPTPLGLQLVNNIPSWLVELHKIAPGSVRMGSN